LSQGTLNFISSDRLEAWLCHRPYESTARDDLESFVWILVLEYYLAADRYNAIPSFEEFFFRLKLLASDRPFDVLVGQCHFGPYYDYLHSFSALFREWIVLVRNKEISVEQVYEKVL